LSYTYAVGAFAPEYTPPAPGSYTLPPIDTVTDHALLGADGRPTTLFALTQGRLAVVAFVYTTCIEATGCPLSLGVLHRLDRAIAGDRELARRVTLVTISFDPERDTPARMAVMRSFHAPRATGASRRRGTRPSCSRCSPTSISRWRSSASRTARGAGSSGTSSRCSCSTDGARCATCTASGCSTPRSS